MLESDLISPQGVDNQISVILSSHTNVLLCFLQHHAKQFDSSSKPQHLELMMLFKDDAGPAVPCSNVCLSFA